MLCIGRIFSYRIQIICPKILLDVHSNTDNHRLTEFQSYANSKNKKIF